MEIVNPFILKNKNRMIKYIDDLSAVYECPEPHIVMNGEPSRELALIHSICEIHKEEVGKGG